MTKNILFSQKAKNYRGKYIAVTDNKIVVSGKNRLEVFQLAKKILGNNKKVEGIYYVPQKKDLLTALCVFPNFR